MAHTVFILHALLWLVHPVNIIVDTTAATNDFSVAAIDRNRILKIADADFLAWMLTSKNSKEEEATTNNHSVAYYVRVAVLAHRAFVSAISQ